MADLRTWKHIAILIGLLTITQMLTPLVGRFATRFLRPAIPSRRAMSTFQLDPAIFNKTLYKKVTDVWFPGVDTTGEPLDFAVVKRWFMGSPEERIAFDGVCRDNFGHALEAIGPEALPNPSAQPFIDELKRLETEDSSGDGQEVAWAALSLTLLLDQMPRNIFRTNDGLRKVYNHYDAMSYALSRSLISPSPVVPRVDLHPQLRNSAAHRVWFYMPLVHSEEIEAHNFLDELMNQYKKDLEMLEGHKGTKDFLDGQFKAEREHREILDKFGRYPHRNEALGRQSTAEEEKFLGEGGATFGVAQEKSS